MPSAVSPPQYRIAIVGAGPAGLTLASLLTASPHKFNFTIFDLRSRPKASEVDVPSGNLDLQEGFGLQAIKACNLYDRFLEIESGCTEQTIIKDKHGTVFLDHVGQGRPEISRNALAQLLLSSVPAERIKWDTKVLSVVPPNNKRGERGVVEYKHNSNASSTTDEFDLIVGADGAWSCVRQAIPGAPEPVYSGACSVTLDLPTLPEKDPALNKMLGGGTFACCGDNKVVLSQRGLHNTARVYLFLHSKCQKDYVKELQTVEHDDNTGPHPKLNPSRLLSSLPKTHGELRELLLTHPDFFSTWSEDIKHLISSGCNAQPVGGAVDARPMYMLPLAPYPHPHHPGIALIGDAAHLMTPFAGKGVNVAMADSLSLAEQLKSFASGTSLEENHGGAMDEGLTAYEKVAHSRGKDAMFLTWMSMKLSYDQDGPQKLVQVMAANH